MLFFIYRPVVGLQKGAITMRIVKEADIRKKEILDAAATLFAEKGYDNTSTTDLLEAVGIAKGTLYHHFKSKEAIMDALIERQTDYVLAEARRIAADKSIPVEERMIRTILALHVDTEETEGNELIEHLHKPQNALMHQKTKRIIFQSVPPILAGILEDGIDQGLYDTPYPLECMEMAMSYLDNILDEDMLELTDTQRLEKIRAFIFSLERLLGVKTGGLAYFNEAFLKETGEA